MLWATQFSAHHISSGGSLCYQDVELQTFYLLPLVTFMRCLGDVAIDGAILEVGRWECLELVYFIF